MTCGHSCKKWSRPGAILKMSPKERLRSIDQLGPGVTDLSVSEWGHLMKCHLMKCRTSRKESETEGASKHSPSG